jgi:hypothetical protein
LKKIGKIKNIYVKKSIKDVRFFMKITQNTPKFYANEWIAFDSVRKGKITLGS